MEIFEIDSPLEEAWRGLHRRMARRIEKRKWSILLLGDSGVGKTLLREHLTGEEPNLTYVPTPAIERHDDAKGDCTVTEVPGSVDLMVSVVKLLAQYDLIVIVFHTDREGPEVIYNTFWPRGEKPSVPVIFVGNSFTVPEDAKGRRFWHQLRSGAMCRYFPVVLRDRDTCKGLLTYLRSGAWDTQTVEKAAED